MKRVLWLAPLALLSSPLAAQNAAPGTGVPVRVQLDAMPLGALATMLMRDVMRVPYVISADVLNDHRPVSVNLVMRRSELPVRVVRFLRSQGLTVGIEGGTVYVSKGKQAAQTGPSSGFAYGPQGGAYPAAPVAPPVSYAPSSPPPLGSVASGGPGAAAAHSGPSQSVEPRQLAVISPAHRSVVELAETLRTLLPGLDVAARASGEVQGATIVGSADPDTLAIGGSKPDVAMAVSLVRSLDKPRPQVEIRALVFEVRNTDAKASALSVLANIAGLQVEAGGGFLPGSQFVRIASSGVSAVLSATRTDGRFKVVAEPTLAALSGSAATINAGSQVPTVGSVTYSENGQPIRSIVYRDSGISLTVKPQVRGGEIELSVQQERSSFGRTTTGVDESPTLNRAASTAQVALLPGEAVLLAGLDEKSESSGRNGILGGLLSTRSRDNSNAQLIVMLQADLSPARAAVETGVLLLDAPDEKASMATPPAATEREAA